MYQISYRDPWHRLQGTRVPLGWPLPFGLPLVHASACHFFQSLTTFHDEVQHLKTTNVGKTTYFQQTLRSRSMNTLSTRALL